MRSQCLRDAEACTLAETGECMIERPVKPQPGNQWAGCNPEVSAYIDDDVLRVKEECSDRAAFYCIRSPLGQPGERRWCQETWCNPDYLEDGITCRDYTYYKATHDDPKEWRGCWRSPVTMPRWASRFTVEVLSTDVFIRDGVWCWRARVRRVEDA